MRNCLKGRSNPRILMIAPVCFPPNNPEAFVNSNLAATFIAAGWHVTILTQSSKKDAWYPNDPEAWGDLSQSVVTYNETEYTHFNRLFALLKIFVKCGHFVRGVSLCALPAIIKAFSIIAKEKRFDVILSRALPEEAHLSALIIAKKAGIPWIANWNDPVPGEKFPEPFPGGRGKHASLGFWKDRFYRGVANRADWHTFPSERLRRYITDYLPKGIYEKSSVVPHIVLDKSARSFRKGREFTLMHAGSLQPPRSPDAFFKGVRLFRERNRLLLGFSVVFIVDRPDIVRNAAKSHGVEDVIRIENSRPYTEMSAVLTSADVLVIIEANMKEGIFLPSKFVDYVGTGRPILAISPKSGTIADILRTNGGGLAVDCESPDEIAVGIETLYKSWRHGVLDENYASDRLIKMFDKESVMKRYFEIFSKLGIRCA